MFVFRPMAAMATTIRNLLSVFSGAKKEAATPKVNGDGGDEAGGNKVKDEEGEDSL